jgi:hypothetical protein
MSPARAAKPLRHEESEDDIDGQAVAPFQPLLEGLGVALLQSSRSAATGGCAVRRSLA